VATETRSLTSTSRSEELLALLDWKRRIFGLYQEVRAASAADAGWQRWREARDELFRTHPQSPLPAEARAHFAGLNYFPYEPALRVLAEVVSVESKPTSIGASGGEGIVFERFAQARFELMDEPQTLDLYWLEVYGGGLFLPFADQTSGPATYPAGRYLLDTVKGADLGGSGSQLVLDFNFAYNPSCAYDPNWVCPLSPPANRLDVAVRAGERRLESAVGSR
jgi:uncharacterized protein (DUF1684 family)